MLLRVGYGGISGTAKTAFMNIGKTVSDFAGGIAARRCSSPGLKHRTRPGDSAQAMQGNLRIPALLKLDDPLYRGR
ncbi:hypothetical protein LP419_27050 [Massilia sp. H-1]|nr:hypothetical protein LP419_27050 [Massilia sp. H-1]